MKEMLTVLDAIANEENGITLGAPWKRSDASLGAVIPIISEASVDRPYIMLQEAEKNDKAHVEDTGKIDGVKIKNTGKKPVFVRSSSIFKGNTQERAATVSVVVEPEQNKEVEVKCVHASRGISGGAKMRYSGHVAPRKVSMSMRGGQGAVWASVGHYTMSMASSRGGAQFAASDDLVGALNYGKEKEGFDKALGKVECLKNQIGIIVFDEEGIAGLEIFDHPDSWKAFHDSVIQSYKDVLVKESKTKLYKLDLEGLKSELKGFIEKCKKCAVRLHQETATSQTYLVENGGISGEFTLIKEKIMHLLFLVKRAVEEEQLRPQPQQFGQPIGYGQIPFSPQPISPSIGPYGDPPARRVDPYHHDPRRRRNDYYYGEPYDWRRDLNPRRPPRIRCQSSSFMATTSKMGDRSIINVPSEVSKQFRHGTQVEVYGIGRKRQR